MNFKDAFCRPDKVGKRKPAELVIGFLLIKKLTKTSIAYTV